MIFNRFNTIFLLAAMLVVTNKVEAMKIETAQAPLPIGPYSQAIQSDSGMIFVSGQIPINPATNELITDVREATMQIMNYIGAVLKSANADYSNIIKTTIYLTDMCHFAEVNQMYASYFNPDKPYPARETVCVKALPKGALIEISVIAYK